MKNFSCSIRHDRFLKNAHEIAECGCGIELIGIAVESSEKLKKWQEYNINNINKTINECNVPIYYHGYFYDVDIGLSDSIMREYSVNTLLSELEFCSRIGAGQCIMHNAFKPGIVDVYYDFWKQNYRKSLETLLSAAEKYKVKICLENFWDKDISFTTELLAEFKSQYLGLCVDIGHINAFGNKNFEEWIKEFRDQIVVFHLTDNNGVFDEHLAIGEGNIDYKKFFQIYKNYGLTSRLNIETYNDIAPLKKSIQWISENTDLFSQQ